MSLVLVNNNNPGSDISKYKMHWWALSVLYSECSHLNLNTCKMLKCHTSIITKEKY